MSKLKRATLVRKFISILFSLVIFSSPCFATDPADDAKDSAEGYVENATEMTKESHDHMSGNNDREEEKEDAAEKAR